MRKILALVMASAALNVGSIGHAETDFSALLQTDEASTTRLDYGTIDEFYALATKEAGDRFDIHYAALNQNALPTLQSYVESLASIDPTSLETDEQLAYWLNLRNLLVITQIAEKKTTGRLTKDRGSFNEPGRMWVEKVTSVNGVSLSLQDIEENIILKKWSDPRLIYGLYQGVQGGVFFQPKNFTGADVWDELERRGQAYLSTKTLRIRRSSVGVPTVYSWYKTALFANQDSAVLEHVKAAAGADLASKLEGVHTISYYRMNYSLDIIKVQNQREQPRGGGGGYGS